MTAATLRLGQRSIPVLLPSIRDARLHTAAVIISVHIIGITALGFSVSVPQIVAAILTAGLIDVALTYRATGSLVWPASGMLTGSGVALILRLVGMQPGDHWSWQGVHWYVLVAGVSVLTKHLIRRGGSHVFNPSNIGLVLAFLIVGSDTLEPLDFWWAPLGPGMLLAYALIVVGGVVITRRLRLLEMAAAFWVTLGLGLAVLAASGHCMVAAWSTTPVCDARFWATLVGSPEILVFLFFMITDPKTVPSGRAARLGFAATLGIFATLMIAPHSTEYGAKVGLLASLAVWSPLRGWFDKVLPGDEKEGSGLSETLGRILAPTAAPNFLRGMVLGAVSVLLALAVVAAGTPARQPAVAAAAEAVIEVEVDGASLPAVVVDPSVTGIDIVIDQQVAQGLAVTLTENLLVEAEAIRTADSSLLGLVSGGERLDEIQAKLDTAIATGRRETDFYSFESLRLSLHEAPEGQTSAGLVFHAEGTVAHVVHDANGVELSRESERFRGEFVMRRLAGERWLLVSVAVSDG